MNVMTIIAIVIYLSGMLLVGFYYSKRNKSTDDFYLGGRKLGPLVTAMSAEASDMSAYLLMGIPGLALATGLAEAVWTAIGLSVGTYLNWLIVSKRLRNYTEKVNAVTVPEFFNKRFGKFGNFSLLSLIAALVIIVFFVPYTASGFSACGKLFSSMFGVDYLKAMIVSAVIIVIYCSLGGFLAASTTDLIQSIVMTLSLIAVLGLGTKFAGGVEVVGNNVKELAGYLDLSKGYDIVNNKAGSYGFITVISTLAWGLGYFGMPHILLRFMAIDNPKKLKTSRRIASVWVVISMAIAILIGVVGYSLMLNGTVPSYLKETTALSASAAESIIVDISSYLRGLGYLPAFFAGIFISGILASTMSTADSQLIAASSSVTQDLLVDSFKIKLSEKTSMLIARLSVVVISVIAVFLAKNPNGSVFKIVSFAWAGFGAAFGPVIILALFWKRTNKYGALAGMISGGAMVFFWKFGIRVWFKGTALDIYELLPAFIVACVFIVVISLITPKPEKEIIDTFEDVKLHK